MCDGNTGCQERYNDMDCLPVDEFTINSKEIDEANIKLGGCTFPNGKVYLLMGAGVVYPLFDGIDTDKRNFSSAFGGSQYDDDLREFTNSDFYIGYKGFVGAGLKKTPYFGELIVSGHMVLSDRIEDKGGGTPVVYDENGDNAFGSGEDKAAVHYSMLINTMLRAGMTMNAIGLSDISIIAGLGVGKRYDNFYVDDLGVGVNAWRTAFISELGARFQLNDFFSINAVYQHPIFEGMTEGQVRTNNQEGSKGYRATPTISFDLIFSHEFDDFSPDVMTTTY